MTSVANSISIKDYYDWVVVDPGVVLKFINTLKIKKI